MTAKQGSPPVALQPRRPPGPMSDLSRELLDMERRQREMAAQQPQAVPPAIPPPAKPRA